MPSGAFFRIRIVTIHTPFTIMKLSQYLKETKNELKEVVFPTTSTTITFTMIVVLISVGVAVLLGGVDFGLREALAKIINR